MSQLSITSRRFYWEGGTLDSPSDWDGLERGVEVVTLLKNQGQCSSCLALSIAVALERALAVDNGWTQTMSEQQLVDCDKVNYACDSGLMSNGFDFAEKNALRTEVSITTP